MHTNMNLILFPLIIQLGVLATLFSFYNLAPASILDNNTKFPVRRYNLA